MREQVGDARAGAGVASEPVVIKKYANRRLYNTGSGRYVTLADLRTMVQAGVDVVVVDVPTGADITRQILGQIILDTEASGEMLLPDAFLRGLIGLYGEDMSSLVPSYLQMAMDAFSGQKDRFADRLQLMGGVDAQGAALFRQQVSHNLMVFDRAMRMFAPPVPGPDPAPDLADLYRQLGQMQGMLDRLAAQQA